MRKIIDAMRDAYQWLVSLANHAQSPLLLLIRLYWGWQFMQDGWGKLHHLDRVTQFFASLNLPAPGTTALCVALVELADPGYSTSARELTGIAVAAELTRVSWGEASVHFGDVAVTRQVTSFVRRSAETGQPLAEEPLELPARTLATRAVWWTISPGQRAGLAAAGHHLGGAAHAAEHASIGLLPLVAACDRWDVGGVSADLHPATGRLTVFVYDGHQGGAGFAERGFAAAADWLRATAQAITSCGCTAGCPSCIQSPKCGSGNHPLDKQGAVELLASLLRGAAG